MNSEPAQIALFEGRIEVWRRRPQRIERISLVNELDRQPCAAKLQRDFGVATRSVRIAVFLQVGDQFLKHNENSRLLFRRDRVVGYEISHESTHLLHRAGIDVDC